jgi:hypothetical protein
VNRETIIAIVVLGVPAALFLWSPRAGLAGILAIALAAGWLYSRDLAERRKRRRRCSLRMTDALAPQGASPDPVFHSAFEARAIGIADGRVFIVATPEEAEIFSADALVEARARRLKQGDFEIGFCVPGRNSGKPFWHSILVRRRAEALHWVRTTGPILRERLKADELA